jgi:hypothetical protein
VVAVVGRDVATPAPARVVVGRPLVDAEPVTPFPVSVVAGLSTIAANDVVVLATRSGALVVVDRRAWTRPPLSPHPALTRTSAVRTATVRARTTPRYRRRRDMSPADRANLKA